MGRFTGLLGLVAILAVAWLLSRHKRAIKLRIILWGLGLQFGFAVLVLKTDVGKLFQAASVASPRCWVMPKTAARSSSATRWEGRAARMGTVFAFQVLPIIIFIASFFSILYYLGIMQWIVKAFAIGMQKIMGASGAESLNVAASIFMGQTEAPLTIRPFIAGLTESELFTIMVSGMAHVSGAVMAAYVKFAHVEIQHLLTAVIMTAPATIMLAKIFEPEVGNPVTAGKVEVKLENTFRQYHRCGGAGRGRRTAFVPEHRRHADCVSRSDRAGRRHFRVGARHGGLDSESRWNSCSGSSSRRWHGCWAFRGTTARRSARLLGERLVTNEFIAFIDLGKIKNQLDPHSFTIATYALCGFANFSSIAIQVGGIGALAPSRKSDLARLGMRAVAAGTMANFMSACIAGILL